MLHIFSSFLKFISSYQINVRVLLANHQKNKAVSNIISFEKPYYSMLKVNLEDTTGNIVVALDVKTTNSGKNAQNNIDVWAEYRI